MNLEELEQENIELKKQLVDKEISIERLNEHLIDKVLEIKLLGDKLAESEKKHLLDEKEWQHYCAYKYIEPQIKGCLDREWQYEKKIDQLKQQLAEKEKEIIELKRIGEKGHLNDLLEDKRKENKMLIKAIEQATQDKISFAVEKIKQLQLLILSSWGENACNLFLGDVCEIIDSQIKQLKGEERKKF